ncbi:MAG: GlxA family transcriptional regulator [Acidimicrobiia bacterium]|nr:GlxA family transcriptional regulator [Acidimicrobiia bacterium]
MVSRTVHILCYPEVQILDAAGPHEVFAGANRWLDAHHSPEPGYDIGLIAPESGPVTSESGLTLVADSAWSDVDPESDIDTLVIAGGNGVYAQRDDPGLVAWVAVAAQHARRVASVCSGAFVLAEAGLLDHTTATTHWARARRLADEYPQVSVDPDPLYIRHGNVWTSAGVTAGIDLALAMVEDDLGPDAAQTIARWLVMFLRRPGGQSQFAPAVWSEPSGHAPVRQIQDHINADPATDLSIATLAARAGMSERNFTRVFTRDVGEPPGRYVERVRIEAARRTLEQESLGVDVVAARCGFGTAETMRRTFIRHLGVPPSSYRDRFTLSPTPHRGVNQ